MWPNLQETAGLVTFTEEILHGKLCFLCSVTSLKQTHLFFVFFRISQVRFEGMKKMSNFQTAKVQPEGAA